MKLPVIGEVKVKKLLKILFMLFLFLYIVFPFDLLPEALFGGIGFIDDIIAGLILWQELKETGIFK
ncbi:MAG: hypothetical protein DRN78_00035 [Thermoproteota archaeon]|nr:MAG: hypothetical protein DRN78_00035 [Candidatus Korarchaeota archaeon]